MVTTTEKKKAIIELLQSKNDDIEAIERIYAVLSGEYPRDAKEQKTATEAKYTITAKQDTVLKIQPVDSSTLADDQKRECKAGIDLDLDELEIVGNSHLKLKLAGRETYEYAFKPHWDLPSHVTQTIKAQSHQSIMGVFNNEVTTLKLSQPDASTCQSACVAMAIGTTDIYAVRSALTSRGVAGDPSVMSWYLNRELGERHIFDDNASMSEMREWLRNGEFLVTYGWFTNSGHVIALDGVSIETGSLAYKFDVSDPWSEFDFSSWSYNKLDSVKFFDGYYSALGIYAACVAGQSVSHARQIYASGTFDSNRKGAWVHRIKNVKK